MKSLLVKIFIEHWPRKLLAILLATVIWLVVNHSLTATRTINNIPVRIVNIPPGKTIEGLQGNNKLAKKLNVTLVGNKAVLDELTPYDFEIVLDAQGRPDEWVAVLSTKNIASLNPEIDMTTGIKRIYHPNLMIRMTTVITDKIPVTITQPIGEAPRGFQFLDVWPYRLYLTVTGPETVIKQLKTKEQRITFNLSDISKAQLDAVANLNEEEPVGVVSFVVPDQWKQLIIPSLSENPISINDPQAKLLRIDFIHCKSLPIDAPIPIALYFPPDFAQKLNPTNITLAVDDLVKDFNGITLISQPLYANGTDQLFLEIVRNMLQIMIIVAPKSDKQLLDWNLQLINARYLENIYVTTLMSDVSDADIRLMQPPLREEYLRNRFRSYVNNLQLFKADESKFELLARLKEHTVYVEEPQFVSSQEKTP
ncbi:MAG TPA: hypothetical protein VGJ00_07445 [Rhabdochlamydiaceae bacterium]|jgi:hypothetical protein